MKSIRGLRTPYIFAFYAIIEINKKGYMACFMGNCSNAIVWSHYVMGTVVYV